LPPQQYCSIYVSHETPQLLNHTYTKNSELLNGGVLLLDSLDVVWNLTRNLGRRVLAEELSKLLLLVIIVRGVTDSGWSFSVIL
jgi:hypothetical protein